MLEWLNSDFSSKALDIFLLCFLIAFTLFAIGAFIKIINPKWLKIKRGKTSVSVYTGDGDPTDKKDDATLKKDDDTPIDVKCIDKRGSLLTHRFFKLLQANQNAGFLDMGALGSMHPKEVVNDAFLRKCKFKVFYEGMSEFVKLQEETSGATLDSILTKINQLVTTYNDMAKSVKITFSDGRYIYGVPDIYIDKFEEWHSEHTKLCLNSINAIMADKLYEDWYAQLRSCLDILHFTFELTIIDARRTLNSLNGNLDRAIEEKLRSAQYMN